VFVTWLVTLLGDLGITALIVNVTRIPAAERLNGQITALCSAGPALEFERPGEMDPFSVRGRVVEPAVALHGDVQPQLDGLPGFRRGIEFLGHTAGRESRRLASALTHLIQREDRRS